MLKRISLSGYPLFLLCDIANKRLYLHSIIHNVNFMLYTNESKTIFFNSDAAVGYHLAATPLNDLVKLEIQPSCRIENHKLPVAVTFYVIKGRGVLEVDQVEEVTKEGDVIFVPPFADRSWENKENDVLEILVVKAK